MPQCHNPEQVIDGCVRAARPVVAKTPGALFLCTPIGTATGTCTTITTATPAASHTRTLTTTTVVTCTIITSTSPCAFAARISTPIAAAAISTTAPWKVGVVVVVNDSDIVFALRD